LIRTHRGRRRELISPTPSVVFRNRRALAIAFADQTTARPGPHEAISNMVKLETSSGERLLLFLPLGLLRCLLSPLRHVALLVSSGDVAKCSRESTCTAIRLHHSGEKNSALQRTSRFAAPRAHRDDRRAATAASAKTTRALHKTVAAKIFLRCEKPAWNGPFLQFRRARTRARVCAGSRAFAARGSQIQTRRRRNNLPVENFSQAATFWSFPIAFTLGIERIERK